MGERAAQGARIGRDALRSVAGSRPGAASFLLLWLLVLVIGPASATPAPHVQGGELDARGYAFGSAGPLTLDGEWSFAWNEWVAPGAEPVAGPYETVHVPGAWKGLRYLGQAIPGGGYATYRLLVRLDGQEAPLALYIPQVRSAFRLYINGRLAAQLGEPGRNLTAERPRFRPLEVDFSPRTGVNEFVFQVSNHSLREGGVWRSVQLGEPAQVQSRMARELSLEMFLLGAILVMGVYHLGVFGLRRRDRPALYFGLFCIVVGSRMLVLGQLPILQLFPGLPWSLQLKIEYWGIFLMSPVFLAYTRHLFPAETPLWGLRAGAVFAVAGSLFVLTAPARLYTQFLLPAEAVTMLLAVMIVIAFWRAVRRGEEHARLLFVGSVFGSFAALHDMLFFWDLVHGPQFMPFAMFFFVLLQAFILARRFSRALLAQIRLTAALRRSRRLITAGEERVRQEVAELLHGPVQSRLLLALNHLSEARASVRSDPALADQHLVAAFAEIDGTRREDVRKASHQLHPEVIRFGLEPALHALIESHVQPFAVRLRIDPRLQAEAAEGDALSGQIRLAAYRIVEEALANVAKHAAAQHVDIAVALQDDARLHIAVSDDGRGTHAAATSEAGGGLGFALISARTGELGGEWRIGPAPGGGTRFEATLPIREPAASEGAERTMVGATSGAMGGRRRARLKAVGRRAGTRP